MFLIMEDFMKDYNDNLTKNGAKTDEIARKSEKFQDAITDLMKTIESMVIDKTDKKRTIFCIVISFN